MADEVSGRTAEDSSNLVPIFVALAGLLGVAGALVWRRNRLRLRQQ
jgi:MYXO-CTERM domain-containing protein